MSLHVYSNYQKSDNFFRLLSCLIQDLKLSRQLIAVSSSPAISHVSAECSNVLETACLHHKRMTETDYLETLFPYHGDKKDTNTSDCRSRLSRPIVEKILSSLFPYSRYICGSVFHIN